MSITMPAPDSETVSAPAAVRADRSESDTGSAPDRSRTTYPAASDSRQATAEQRALSVSSLVLGITGPVTGLAFAGPGVILPIVGLILGILALGREPSSRTMAIWGIALNGVALAGLVLAILIGLALLVPFGLAALLAV